MEIASNRTPELLEAVVQKLSNGIEQAMAAHAAAIHYEVTRRVVASAGRSVPGEYPAKDTGLLSESIAYAVDKRTGHGIVGVTGTPERRNKDRGGLPLLWLEDLQGRLGMRAAFEQYRSNIVADIKAGASL